MAAKRVSLILLGTMATVALAAVSASNWNFDHQVVFEGLDGQVQAEQIDKMYNHWAVWRRLQRAGADK